MDKTMKKVVSFSLFGSNPKYLVGIIENAKLMEKYYSGWEMRVYVNHTVPESTKEELQDLNAKIFEKESSGGYTPLFWRFDPLYDSDVNIWISRDADSRLSERESLAVEEWLKHDKTFHLMRDSHNHDCYNVLAGMFGVKNKLFNSKYPGRQFYCTGNIMFEKDCDQLSMDRYQWEVIKDDHVCHDHWAHTAPATTNLLGISRNPLETYDGQGVLGHVINRRKNYPHQFSENSINLPFSSNSVENGLYVGQIIEANNTPAWNDDVYWEYQLRGQ